MTEEEINKKAEKHCNEVLCNAHEKCNEVIKCRDWRSRRAGYFCGYEQALKDFEKENAELNGKNKELGDRLCNVANNLLDNWCRNEEDYCPHLAKLEKENAKLETDYEVLSCSVGDFGELQEKLEEEQRKNNGLSDNLTKAKDLLNEFMRISKSSDEDFEHDYSELIGETEQFLKDDSCPDCFCEDCTKEDCGIKKLGLM